MSDLCDRMRAWIEEKHPMRGLATGELLREAVARIEELEAEVARLSESTSSVDISMTAAQYHRCLDMLWDALGRPISNEYNVYERAAARIRELDAIVAKLPLTADGVRVVPGMIVYVEAVPIDNGVVVTIETDGYYIQRGRSRHLVAPAGRGRVVGYSTREEAEAAMAEKENK